MVSRPYVRWRSFSKTICERQQIDKAQRRQFQRIQSNNYPELAKIGLGIQFNHDVLHKVSEELPLRPHFTLDTNVMPIDLFPGLSAEILRHQLFTPGVKGIVLRTYGAGNAPTAQWFIDAVRECIPSGRVILNVTQCSTEAFIPNDTWPAIYWPNAESCPATI